MFLFYKFLVWGSPIDDVEFVKDGALVCKNTNRGGEGGKAQNKLADNGKFRLALPKFIDFLPTFLDVAEFCSAGEKNGSYSSRAGQTLGRENLGVF